MICKNCGFDAGQNRFCTNCGAKKPEPDAGWDCACGQKGIKDNFCPNCGSDNRKKGEN